MHTLRYALGALSHFGQSFGVLHTQCGLHERRVRRGDFALSGLPAGVSFEPDISRTGDGSSAVLVFTCEQLYFASWRRRCKRPRRMTGDPQQTAVR